jgi:hypothetical protein
MWVAGSFFLQSQSFLQSSNFLSSPPPPHLHLASVQQPKYSDQPVCLHPSSTLREARENPTHQPADQKSGSESRRRDRL